MEQEPLLLDVGIGRLLSIGILSSLDVATSRHQWQHVAANDGRERGLCLSWGSEDGKMSWITALKTPGHIAEAVTHFNEASERMESRESRVEASRCLFDALNKIQTEWLLHERDQTMGEVKAFQTMIVKGLLAEARNQLLQTDEMKNLVLFEPQIMNHDTLRRHQYRPGVDIEPSLVRKSSEEHRKLLTAYNGFLLQRNDEIEEQVLKRAAELLYVVRSNIAHGEKTPYGPDLKKRERDERVCTILIPLQVLLFNCLLEFPDRKLVTYGTLAPGRPNHHILSDLQGDWKNCTLEGHLEEVDGLPIFRWQASVRTIEASLLLSPDLPRRWRQIDRFEGSSYKRRLITVATDVGISVANIYASALH